MGKNVRNKLISSVAITLAGAAMAIASGIMAGNYPIDQMPKVWSIVGAIGMIFFMVGIIPIFAILMFGGEDE